MLTLRAFLILYFIGYLKRALCCRLVQSDEEIGKYDLKLVGIFLVIVSYFCCCYLLLYMFSYSRARSFLFCFVVARVLLLLLLMHFNQSDSRVVCLPRILIRRISTNKLTDEENTLLKKAQLLRTNDMHVREYNIIVEKKEQN